MENNVKTYLLEITKTNRTLDSYVDWNKVKINYEKHKINLAQLNVFTKTKTQEDLKKYINQIFELKREDVFVSLEILIAKRDSEKEYLDKDDNFSIKEYSLTTPEGVYLFIKETNLIQLFNSVNSLDDYVFGVEVGLDTNGRKNRAGKTMETLISKLLDEVGIEYQEQVDISKIQGIKTNVKKIKKVDFVFEKNDKTYLIESSFYNAGGSKISEVCNSYADFTSKLDKNKFEMIWVADGRGMNTIQRLLEEQWKNVNVMNIKQFKKMLQR